MTSSQTSSQPSSQPTITPSYVVAFFADEDARVNDEVDRILALLLEREPGSGRPKHIKDGWFSLTLLNDVDAAFMEKVAVKFNNSGNGWTAKNARQSQMGRDYKAFMLGHESFKALPAAPRRGMVPD
jgi:hypothetical protein